MNEISSNTNADQAGVEGVILADQLIADLGNGLELWTDDPVKRAAVARLVAQGAQNIANAQRVDV